jgi:N-formylglutamate amidohydrolase
MKYPILIVIPHGGYQVPEELSEITFLGKTDLFMEADTCANDIFSFERYTLPRIDTPISRYCVDLDRPLNALPPSDRDGIIKHHTHNGRPVFMDDLFPDEIALSNIFRRYYMPFHDTLDSLINSGTVRLMLECHTVPAVAPPSSKNAGEPRPLVQVDVGARYGGSKHITFDPAAAAELAISVASRFSDDAGSVAGDYHVNREDTGGYIQRRYGTRGVPMAKLSISKSLFINEKHFNWDYLSVDELRLGEIRNAVWEGIEAFYKKAF